MTFDLTKQMPRIGDRAEVLVAWYLRFNGFFPLPNFILHDAGVNKAPGQQLTEADVLAMRLPFTREIIAAPNGTICTAIDPRLELKEGTTDFIIVEATSEECKFNWLDKPEREQRLFFVYAMQRFGHWQESELAVIAERLSVDRFWQSGNTRLRLLSFGLRMNKSASWPERIKQITLEETLDYLRMLFSCYGRKPNTTEKYFVSDHRQWDPLIKEVYGRLLGHKMQQQSPSEILNWLFC